jgi:hypothetical protein
MDLNFIVIVAAIFLLGGIVKGVIGLGLATISLALLSAAFGLPVAVQLIVIPSVVTNFWQAIYGGAFVQLLGRFWSMLLASALGTWLAYGVLLVAHPKAMTLVLGVILCLYALNDLRTFIRIPRIRREKLASPVVGLMTGVLAGSTGSMVMPVIAYLQGLGLKRDDLIQMMGISFTVSTCAIGLAIVDHNGFDTPLLMTSMAALVPALVGMKLGQMLRGRLSETLFHRYLLLGLLVIGVHLIWKGIV